MKPAAVLAAALLAACLAGAVASPADAHPRKPPIHCKPPFRPRYISAPGYKAGWYCMAISKPLPH